jgi:hypothetical protein
MQKTTSTELTPWHIQFYTSWSSDDTIAMFKGFYDGPHVDYFEMLFYLLPKIRRVMLEEDDGIERTNHEENCTNKVLALTFPHPPHIPSDVYHKFVTFLKENPIHIDTGTTITPPSSFII